MMFQVMVFSMLHYSISQSNNSTFSHQRTLSRLIVYHHPPPSRCCSLHFPLCCLPAGPLVRSNHGDGPLLDGAFALA